MRALAHVGAVLLALGGGGLVVLYVVAVIIGSQAGDDPRELGALLGIGASGLVAALLIELAVLRRRGVELVTHLGMPPLWLSAALFVLTVSIGGLAIWTDWVPVVEPMLAIVGTVAAVMFVWRLVTRWSPRRRAPAHTLLATMAWGMVVATTTAVALQFAFLAAGIGGIAAGLRAADTQVPGGLLERLLSEDFLADSGDDLVGTATVALFIMLVYAVAAPLTEELTKFLGVLVVMRRRVLTRYTVFVAGISAGLGFAAVESIGYALGAGEGWPLILVLRAPVTLIHVTGTSLVACGWYLQRTRGGIPLLGYFVVAVLVHAAWNGLLVSVMMASAALPSSGDADPLLVLGVLAALGLMLVLLGGCLTWVIANARRWGREANDPVSASLVTAIFAVSHPAVPAAVRAAPVSGSLFGEV